MNLEGNVEIFFKMTNAHHFDLAVFLLGIYLTGMDHMASTRSAQVILITVMFEVPKTRNLLSVY